MVNSVRAIKASIGRSPGRASNQPMHGNMREKHGNMREKKAARRGRRVRRQTTLIRCMQRKAMARGEDARPVKAGTYTQHHKENRDPCLPHAG
jgi:hypothetical protein